MKKIILIALLVIIIGGVIAVVATNVNSNSEKEEGKINVVISNFASYDFLKAITKDVEGVNLNFLLGPGKDMHSYDPTPQDMIKMQNSDMFVYIGEEIEPWAEEVIKTFDNPNQILVKIAEETVTQPEKEVEGAEHHHHDEDAHDHENESHEHEEESHEHEEESHDHENESHEHEEESHEHEHEEDAHEHEEEHHEHSHAFDAHVWTSLDNAILMVNALKKDMIKLDEENANKYEANATAYIAEIEELDVKIQEIVDNSDNDKLVFGDKMPMQYFIDQYDLEVAAAFAGCSTETEPGTKTLVHLSDLVREENIPVILYTEMNDGKVAKSIAEAANNGAQIMQIQTFHNITKDNFENGATYVSLMESNLDVLKAALK